MAYRYDNIDVNGFAGDEIPHWVAAPPSWGRMYGTDDGATEQSSATALPMGQAEHNRILIVDDHSDTGRALKTLLRRRGYDAEYVTSGHAAVETIRRGGLPRLVILDVMMPDMSGLQALEEMRRTDDFDNTPVVMYSASEDPATIQQAFRLGARDYILKGSDWDEMMRRIDTALPA